MSKFKIVLVSALISFISVLSYADFEEGIDYKVSYKQRETNYADILHINFFTMRPAANVAEKIMINHLREYGRRAKNTKNIIGSAHYSANGIDGSYVKIKFSDSLGAYVWVDKVGRVMNFPSYMSYLKRVKDQKRKDNS